MLQYEVTGDAEIVRNEANAIVSVNLPLASTSSTPLSGPISRMFSDGAAVTVTVGQHVQLPCETGYIRTAENGSCAIDPACPIGHTANITTNDCAPATIACPPDTTNVANKRCVHVVSGNTTCPEELYLKNNDCFTLPSCNDAQDTLTAYLGKWLCLAPEICQAFYKRPEGGNGCAARVPLSPLPTLSLTIDTADVDDEGVTTITGLVS